MSDQMRNEKPGESPIVFNETPLNPLGVTQEEEIEEDKSIITLADKDKEAAEQEKLRQQKLQQSRAQAPLTDQDKRIPKDSTRPEDNKEVDKLLAEQSEAEQVVPIQTAVETIQACMEVLNNIEWISLDSKVKKQVILKRMDALEAEMQAKLGPAYKPDLKPRDLKTIATVDVPAMREGLTEQGYREKVAPITHDKSAELGSALEALKGLVVKPKPGLTKGFLPALAAQTDIQQESFVRSSLPNVDFKKVKDVRDRVIDLQRNYKTKMERLKEGRGLMNFAKEDMHLLVQAGSDTLKTAFYINPQIRLVLAVKEAVEALLNEKNPLRKVPLAVNVGLQAVLGICKTLLGVPDAVLSSMMALDTRVFYIAFGFLKAGGVGKLNAGDHELFDRINWATRDGKIGCLATVFGLALTLGYFAGSWAGKQMIQKDVRVPRLMLQAAESFLSGVFSFRSVDFSLKELIKGFEAVVQLMLADLFSRDVLHKEGGQVLKEQVGKLKDPLTAIDPRNWSTAYHFSSGDRSYSSYLTHGTTGWLAQLSQGIFTLAMESLEKPFNERVNKSWEQEMEKRINNEIDKRVGNYQSLQAKYEVMKKDLAQCELEIASEHAIDIDKEKVDDSEAAENVKVDKESKYGTLGKPQEMPEAELVEQDTLLDIKEKRAEDAQPVAEEGFLQLFTPQQLIDFISDLKDDNHSKLTIVLEALKDVGEINKTQTANLRGDLSGAERIAGLVEEYTRLYNSYQPPQPTPVQVSSEADRQVAPPRTVGFPYSGSRRQSTVDQTITALPTTQEEEVIELTATSVSSPTIGFSSSTTS